MIDINDALDAHIETTAEIVAAYVSRNPVPATDLPSLIRSIHESLATLGRPPVVETPAAPPIPAVPVRKSVTDEYIISLEDGRKFKSLKRYLATSHGMTPAEYRAKWNLPSDYPMIAPAYAARRSALAKTIGLGRKGIGAVSTVPVATASSKEKGAEPASEDKKKPRKRTAKAV